MKITLLDPYTRSVILEKFIVPDWFKTMYSKRLISQRLDCKRVYRIFLRLVHGDDLTMAGDKAFINKCHHDFEEIEFDLGKFFIEIGIVDMDSGSFDFNETHYNIYASKCVKHTTK